MAEHKCNMIAEITEMQIKVGQMEHVIDGNGKPGLRDTVVILSEQVATLIKVIEGMENKKKFNITTIISLIAIVISTIAIILKT